MKKLINNTLAIVAFALVVLASALTASAQNLPDGVYNDNDNGIAFRKSAILQTDGSYIIDLEAFVTGEVHIENTSIPADIVLVLDVSGSMDESFTPYTYTARPQQGYSYNSYSNSSYYYKHTDGNYYRVSRGSYDTGGFLGIGATHHYYLTYRVNNTNYYLYGTNVTTNQPSNPSGGTFSDAGDQTIWTGVLYTRQAGTTQTKIAALKTAVGLFIDEIQKNDLIDPNTNQPRETPLGNQISIVKFAMDDYYGSNADYDDDNAPLTVGNHKDNNYNYTEVVAGFTPTATDANVTSLKNTVNGLTPGGATAADYGMNLARLLLKSLPTSGENDRSGTTKTVVFFTDGAPTYGNSFQNNVANQAIANALPIKNTYKAMVFSIGVFDSETNNIRSFMNRISSNNPNAQSMSQPYDYAQGDYYQNASDADLSEIFKTVAGQSGGSGNTDVTAESAVTVDVVSTSFSIPVDDEDFSVAVLVAPCTGKRTITAADVAANPDYAPYEGETYLTFGAEKTAQQAGLDPITYSIEGNKISTEGFDFSEHWCGEDNTVSPARFTGYKQILRFTIKPRADAVGGPHVYTNDKTSGIYVNGNNVAEFNRPIVKLPVNIWIKKEGLLGDDSAVFTLYRAPYTGSNTRPADSAFDTFTKILVNNEIMDEDGLVKITGLDPNYFYKIKEDAWAWSYDYQDYEVQYTVGEGIHNPFVFVNEPKDDIVKHSEATYHNVFTKKTTPVTPTPSE